MKSKLPIKSLVYMNIIVATVVGVFLFLLQFLFEDVREPILFFSVSVVADFLAIGFLNILILKIVYSSGVDGKCINKRIRWYLAGYILSCFFFNSYTIKY